MTYVNNRKYIAEAWIENRNDEEFKKSFLKALLLQWSGHGKGFDADTVDGKHYEEIETLIRESVAGVIKEFYIGQQEFSAERSGEDQKYYLGFDAIKLFLDESDGVPNWDGPKELPWEEEPRTENLTLYQVFQSLYTYTQSQYRDIKSKLEIVDTIKNSVDSDGHLNADSVNGLRFFILTQDQYDTMKNEEPETINDIHNIFIIKELEQLIDAGYDDGYYDGNPNRAPISKAYKFAVMPYTDVKYDEDTGEVISSETANWLMYRYDGYAIDDELAEWKPLCKTSDFIDSEELKNDVDELLGQHTDYIYNAIKSFDTEEQGTDFDLLNYGKENFIKGAFYKYQTEDSNTPVDKIKINDFSYLNLTGLYNELEEEINTVSESLDNYKDTNNNALSSIETNVTTNASEIENIKNGTSGKTLTTLNNNINRLQQSINNLQSSINDITTWEERITGALHFPGSTSTGESYLNFWVDKIENLAKTFAFIPVNYTKVYVNEPLKLGVVLLNFYHYHSATSQIIGQWCDPAVKYLTTGKIAKVTTWNNYINGDKYYGSTTHLENTDTYIRATPKTTIVFNIAGDSNTLVKLTPDGDNRSKIEVNSKLTSAKWIHIYGHYVFRLY